MVAAATRLIPYEMVNFTAIGALAFMGGAMIENKWLRYSRKKIAVRLQAQRMHASNI